MGHLDTINQFNALPEDCVVETSEQLQKKDNNHETQRYRRTNQNNIWNKNS